MPEPGPIRAPGLMGQPGPHVSSFYFYFFHSLRTLGRILPSGRIEMLEMLDRSNVISKDRIKQAFFSCYTTCHLVATLVLDIQTNYCNGKSIHNSRCVYNTLVYLINLDLCLFTQILNI